MNQMVRLKPDPTNASRTAVGYGSSRTDRLMALSFPVGKEMRVDEVVDEGLVGRLDALELHAHADAAIAPRHPAAHVDVTARSGHPEPDLDSRAGVEGARGADRKPAAAQVKRQRGGDRVAEAVLHGDAQDHPWAASAVEVVGEQVG